MKILRQFFISTKILKILPDGESNKENVNSKFKDLLEKDYHFKKNYYILSIINFKIKYL